MNRLAITCVQNPSVHEGRYTGLQSWKLERLIVNRLLYLADCLDLHLNGSLLFHLTQSFGTQDTSAIIRSQLISEVLELPRIEWLD